MLRLSPLLLLAALALTIPSARAITFADWIASYGLTGPSAEATADPDADGLPNLLEYALAGLVPNVANNSATSASLPVYGFARRTGDALGAWEWVEANQRGTGLGGIWHAGIRYIPRPGIVGIRFKTEITTDINGWFSGRSATMQEVIGGTTIQSITLRTGNTERNRWFARLRVTVDAGTAADGTLCTDLIP
jgi:hypothetical protein